MYTVSNGREPVRVFHLPSHTPPPLQTSSLCLSLPYKNPPQETFDTSLHLLCDIHRFLELNSKQFRQEWYSAKY
jgi:hypothetical protein